MPTTIPSGARDLLDGASSTTAEGGCAPEADFWRTTRIKESTQRRRGAKARRKNPEGISSFSPGLRSYPGLTTQNQSNPNGVLSGVSCTGTQPRWGCDSLDSGTQGSSSLATLGWKPESLWDLPNRISAAHSKENGDATSTRGRFGLSDPVTNYPKFPFPWLMSFNRGIR